MKNEFVIEVYAVGMTESVLTYVNETPDNAIKRAKKALQACGLSLWYCLVKPVNENSYEGLRS